MQVDLSSYQQFSLWQKKFYELWKTQAVWPQVFAQGNTDSFGEQLEQCVRCSSVYWEKRSCDLFYCRFGIENRDCAFCSGHGWESQGYFCTGGVKTQQNLFCLMSTASSHLEYSINCKDCEYCFGCVGLIHKRFHLFNKPYDEETYWQKVDELKCAMLERGEYGLFFPGSFSPSGFSFSVGQLYLGFSQK